MAIKPGVRVFVKGFLEAFVLYECSRSPKTGMVICQTVETLTNGKWRPSPGTIYPVLARLEKKGLIRAAKAKNKKEKQYATTPAGQAELEVRKKEVLLEVEDVMQTLSPIFARVVHELDDEKSARIASHMNKWMEFRLKVLALPPAKRQKVMDELLSRTEDLDKHLVT